MSALVDANLATMQEIAQRYGQRPYPTLVSGLQQRHHVHL